MLDLVRKVKEKEWKFTSDEARRGKYKYIVHFI